jgi:hypothetical protein
MTIPEHNLRTLLKRQQCQSLPLEANHGILDDWTWAPEQSCELLCQNTLTRSPYRLSRLSSEYRRVKARVANQKESR